MFSLVPRVLPSRTRSMRQELHTTGRASYSHAAFADYVHDGMLVKNSCHPCYAVAVIIALQRLLISGVTSCMSQIGIPWYNDNKMSGATNIFVAVTAQWHSHVTKILIFYNISSFR